LSTICRILDPRHLLTEAGATDVFTEMRELPGLIASAELDPADLWHREQDLDVELQMTNADLKQAVTQLAPARTKLQLVKATAKHLRSVQRQPERIKSYFEHEPVRYAA
jgi:hypothetical protein